MADLTKVVITKKDAVVRYCEHCSAKTVQLGRSGNTCLQCIADGGGCCSIKAYNRWVDKDGKAVTEPRGVSL